MTPLEQQLWSDVYRVVLAAAIEMMAPSSASEVASEEADDAIKRFRNRRDAGL